MIESAEEFVRLRVSERPDEYHRAGHEEAPMSVWLDVIENHPDMKRWVAYNKRIPIGILEILSRDEDAHVRHAVAQKRKLTPALFATLSRDSDDSVRLRIACNAKTPREILETMTDDPWTNVREMARRRLDSPDAG